MLKALREEKGMTQAYVAQILNISAYRLSMYETGARKLPVELIKPLSEIYQVPVERVLECYAKKVV